MRERVPDGSTTTSSPTRSVPAASRPGVPAAAVVRGSRTGSAAARDRRRGRCRPARPRGARAATRRAYHGIAAERSTTLSPCSADTGMKLTPCRPSREHQSITSRTTASKRSSAKPTRSILFTSTVTPGTREQRRDRQVAARLLGHPAARVDEHEREVGGRRARGHVARVLRVAGAVVQHEPPPRRGEVAVRDVDRDALLALGAQAVGQPREVGGGADLVGHQRLGVVQQAADQRRLAVVDRPRRGDPQHLEVPHPLAVFHGGLADAVVGARLAALGDPRGGDLRHHVVERRRRSERTAPVHVMSPTVR